MQYQITAIKSYNPIQRLALTRNELDTVMSSANALSVLAEVEKTGKAKPLCVPGTDPRQQRSSVFLKDVHFAIEADVLPSKNMPEGHTFDFLGEGHGNHRAAPETRAVFKAGGT